MTANHLKESTFIPDKTFPINVFFIKDIHIHWHDHMEWIIIKKGRAVIQVDDVFVELKKGEIAFVNSKQLHSAQLIEEGTELIAIVFNEAIIRNSGLDNTDSTYFSPFLNNQLKLPNFLRGDEKHTKDIVSSILNLIEEFQKKSTGYELFIKAELFRIFGLIFRNFYQLEQTPNRTLKSYNLTVLFNYLRENFNKDISIKQASKMVSLSPNHFCKVFKKVTGKTLIEYLNILRINEAERMLIETDLTVTEIAERVGYGSTTYFGRVFKRIKNVPPTVIRSSQQQLIE